MVMVYVTCGLTQKVYLLRTSKVRQNLSHYLFLNRMFLKDAFIPFKIKDLFLNGCSNNRHNTFVFVSVSVVNERCFIKTAEEF